MAKTSYLSVTAALEEAYFGVLQSGDRFITPRIRPKSALLSQQRVATISARSYLPIVQLAWAGLSVADRAAWKAADQHVHKHGWRCFLADKCQRIKLGLVGNATPSVYHNDVVGKIQIDSPAEEIKLIQPHPQSYWVYKKVSGTKSQYEPSLVTEGFGLPFSLSLCYKSDLVSTGAGSFARLFARIRHLYQGENLDYDLVVEMALSGGWTSTSATASSLIGQAISYNLYLHLYKVRGTLLFDNIKAQHSGSIWTRDQFCKDIDKSFTRAFFQVPAHWAAVTIPDGAAFNSIYPVENMGYALHVHGTTSSPADNATLYFGNIPRAPTAATGVSRVYIRRSGTITTAEIVCWAQTAGTDEEWSMYVRKNDSIDTLIASVSVSENLRVFSNVALSIAVAAGDFIEIKMVCPAWATNPTPAIFGGYIYIE